MCIFSYVEDEKSKNEIKVHKVHKIYHYNYIIVKVNFEARSSLVCIFLFCFYAQKKNDERKQKIFLQNFSYNQK